MSKHCIKYAKLCKGTITFNFDGTANIINYEIHRQEVFKKMAFFDGGLVKYQNTPEYLIHRTCAQKQYKANYEGTKIYIDPKCRTPRDLFRQSKYKIVRNPDDANFFVVPETKKNYFYMTFNVAGSSCGNLYLYNVIFNSNQLGCSQDERIDDAHFEAIKKAFDERGMTMLTDDPNIKRYCYFIPKYDIYEEILCNERPDRAYCTETYLYIDYPTEINLETLQLWSRYSSKDTDALRKAILTSNWKDYPLTMLMFIERKNSDLAFQPDQQFKLVLDTIGYDHYHCINDECSGRMISPEDWKLAQEFIITNIGLPKEGGFISYEDLKKSDNSDLVRRKVAIAPLHINKPMLFDDLLEILK